MCFFFDKKLEAFDVVRINGDFRVAMNVKAHELSRKRIGGCGPGAAERPKRDIEKERKRTRER